MGLQLSLLTDLREVLLWPFRIGRPDLLFASSLDQLTSFPAPPTATAEPAHARDAGCHELQLKLRSYLQPDWRIKARRCFLLQSEIRWYVLESFVESVMVQRRAQRLHFEWHRPGHDLVAVWKIGTLKPAYLAVAMRREPVNESTWLAGYFALSHD